MGCSPRLGIANGVSGSSYEWKVGEVGTSTAPSGDYIIQICQSGAVGVCGFSAALFTIINPTGNTPTASLTLNGKHNITLNVGDSYTWTWSGTNADQYYSTYEKLSGGSACGDGGSWFVNSASGSLNTLITPDMQGCTWKDTYFAKNTTTGQIASDVVNVSVLPPTASLTLNGKHNITLNVGESYTWVWKGTNADQYYSTYEKLSGGSACGDGGDWLASSANGSLSVSITPDMQGCSWKVTYFAKNTATGQIASDIVEDNVAVVVSSQSTAWRSSASILEAVNAILRQYGLERYIRW